MTIDELPVELKELLQWLNGLDADAQADKLLTGLQKIIHLTPSPSAPTPPDGVPEQPTPPPAVTSGTPLNGDTPRTDAVAHAGYDERTYGAKMTELARQLERELAACREERESFYMQYRIKCDEETKRLHTQLAAAQREAEEAKERAKRYQNSWLEGARLWLSAEHHKLIEENESLRTRHAQLTALAEGLAGAIEVLLETGEGEVKAAEALAAYRAARQPSP